MIALSSLISFITVSTLLALTPGPAVLMVIGQASGRGVRSALAGAAGVIAGNGCYVAASIAGLGALLAASPGLLLVLKLLGCGWLVYLALRRLAGALGWTNGDGAATSAAAAAAAGISFRESFLAQLANPKSLLMFGILLPQFIDSSAPATLQMALLGLLSMVIEYPILAAYAGLGARALRWQTPLTQAIAGLLLLAAAVLTAFGDRLAGGG